MEYEVMREATFPLTHVYPTLSYFLLESLPASGLVYDVQHSIFLFCLSPLSFRFDCLRREAAVGNVEMPENEMTVWACASRAADAVWLPVGNYWLGPYLVVV